MPISELILTQGATNHTIDLASQTPPLLSDDMPQLTLMLQQNPRIMSLNLNSNLLGNLGVAALANLSNITELDIGNNEVTDEGIITFAQRLASKILYLYSNYNELTYRGALALVNISSITFLDISQNNMGFEGAEVLGKSLNITGLNISENNIRAEGAKAFAENKTLVSLNIDNNSIGSNGAKALAQNTTLTNLVAYSNHIDDEGAKALANNKTLIRLDLNSNKITDIGAEAFLNNTTLIQLNLSNNPINSSLKLLLERHIVGNGKTRQKEIQTERACFIITALLFALYKYRNNQAKLLLLPVEMILHTLSYLNFPALQRRYRSAKECAEFIFNHQSEFNSRIALHTLPESLRLIEKKATNYWQPSRFGFFTYLNREDEPERKRIKLSPSAFSP